MSRPDFLSRCAHRPTAHLLLSLQGGVGLGRSVKVLPRVIWGCVTLRILCWRYCLAIKAIIRSSHRETCFWNQHRHSQLKAGAPLTCQRPLEQTSIQGHASPLEKAPEHLQTSRRVLGQDFSSKSVTLLEKALGSTTSGHGHDYLPLPAASPPTRVTSAGQTWEWYVGSW